MIPARVRRALPALLAVTFTGIVFGAGFLTLNTRFFGREYVDAWGTQWFYWMTARNAARLEGFGWTDLFFFPWGKDLYLHTGGNVLDGLLAWPLRALLGPVVGYNLFVLAILATNAWAMARLLTRLRLRTPWVPAILFAFNPWALHELRDGRPTQALLAFVLLFWADYLALDQERRLGTAARAGLWLALAGVTYWYNALFSGLAAALVAVIRLRGPRRLGTLTRHAFAGFVAVVLVAPFALPMLGAADVPGRLATDTWTLTSWAPVTREGVSIGLYVFDPASLGSGFWAQKMDGGMAFLRQDTNLFVAEVVLFFLGLWAAPPRVRLAVVTLAVVGLAVAVGPSMGGVPNPLYLLLAKSSAIFQRLWWPTRALVLVHLAVGIVSAFVIARLGRLAPAFAVGVALAWIVELRASSLAPMDTWDARVPPAYACLAEVEEGAVLELPYAYTQAHLWFQATHGRPLFGGMLEDNPVFAPPQQLAYRRSNSLVSALIEQAALAPHPSYYTAADAQALHDLGYRWIVLDKRAYDPAFAADPNQPSLAGGLVRARSALVQLLGAPAWEDPETAIFAPWGDGSPCP